MYGELMKTLDLKEAACMLKMHAQTVRRRALSGEIPAAKPGKCWAFIMVVGAWIGVRIAVWNADKRRHEFFSEMIRRQQEMGPLTMDVWSKALWVKFDGENFSRRLHP